MNRPPSFADPKSAEEKSTEYDSSRSNSEKDEISNVQENLKMAKKQSAIQVKEIGVPQEMYDALKSKLIGQESHIKQLEEEAQVVLEKLKDQEDQMQTMQTMFDEKLKEEKSERDRLLRDSFEREKRYNN